MIAPGNKLALTDLQAVATTANGATSSMFDLTHFKDVSPMFLDLSSNNYGYRNCYAFLLTAGGLGYHAGDQVSLGTTLTFTVATVTASGAVLGLIVTGNSPIMPGGTLVSSPVWPYYNDPVPGTLTAVTGIGIGASITFSVQQVGPTANYSFPDYSPVGTVTGLVVTAGGTGYSVSDSLTLAELPGWSATVATVSSGVITSITFTASSSPSPLPTTIAAMAAIGGHGTGANLGGQFIVPQRPQWLTELNRLRNNVQNSLSTAPPASVMLSCSRAGVGWPKSGYTNSVGSYDPNSSYQEFYFADTGVSESITVSYSASSGAPYAFTAAAVPFANDAYGNFPGTVTYISDVTYTITINCPPGTTYAGTLTQQITSLTRWDGNGPDNGNAVGNTPSGFTLSGPGSLSFGTSPQRAIVTFSGLGSGTYTFVIGGGTVAQTYDTGGYHPSGNDYVQSVVNCIADISPTGYFSFTVFPPSALISGSFTPSLTFNAVATNGIHNSKTVYKIVLPSLNLNPTGYGVTSTYRNAQDVLPNYSGSFYWTMDVSTGIYTFAGVKAWSLPINSTNCAVSMAITPSCYGFWVGSTNPISNPNFATEDLMPWNLQRTKYASGGSKTVNPILLGDQAPNIGSVAEISGSYDQTIPVEQQQEPPAWAASTYFPVGFTIIDTYGNLQQCTVAGQTGSSTPTWPTSPLNVTVTDGAATWKLVAIWSGSFVPAQHRVPNLPRYPVYWQSETLAKLEPPTSTSGLTIWGANNQWQRNGFYGGHDPGWQQDNQALGWWIYSVSVNRINPGGQIPVTIGCMRSGSFVAFATFNTGTTHQVLWPVFTSDALVYQCSERVDIQALALAGSVTTGTTVSAPMCAAFLADVEALLGLI